MVDVTSIQALIGHVKDGDVWVTVNQTGKLVSSTYLDNLEPAEGDVEE